jgi:hypothetical protein
LYSKHLSEALAMIERLHGRLASRTREQTRSEKLLADARLLAEERGRECEQLREALTRAHT